MAFVLALALSAIALPARASAETLASLGDSYSSGEAAPPYDPETDDRDIKRNHKCHRSAQAWPRLLGVAHAHHLACSGARIKHLDRGQVSHRPDNTGQIQRLRELARTTRFDRILLTIGGNDVGFGRRIAHCRANPRLCLNNLGDIARHLRRLGPRLARHYRAINAAGRAPVLVVGYPAIFPAPRDRVRNCRWFTKRSQRRADTLTKLLDRHLAGAARDAGVDYVSMLRGGPRNRDVLDGHELCTKHSYVRAITSKPSDLLGDQQQAHPLAPGQQLMAARVRGWLDEAAGARDNTFLGTWTGTLTTSGGLNYTAMMNLSQVRHPGMVAGSSDYRSVDCGGILTFEGSAGDGSGAIQLREELTYGDGCVDDGRATLTPAGGSSMAVVWTGLWHGRIVRDHGILSRR